MRKTEHSTYNISSYGPELFMDKSGNPIKYLATLSAKEGIIKKYVSFQYDEKGRIIRYIEIRRLLGELFDHIRKGMDRYPCKTLIKELAWDNNNQLILYKDNKGNYFDKAWGIKNPYEDKLPSLIETKLIERYQRCLAGRAKTLLGQHTKE